VLSELRPLPTKERELYDNARHLLVAELAASLSIAEVDAEDAVDVVLFPPGRERPKRTAEEFRTGGDEEGMELGEDLLELGGGGRAGGGGGGRGGRPGAEGEVGGEGQGGEEAGEEACGGEEGGGEEGRGEGREEAVQAGEEGSGEEAGEGRHEEARREAGEEEGARGETTVNRLVTHDAH